mmetsp:Transcript_36820/g.41984  ORF Transcript_36820/g.41984 Transcript_36820/m.41984 type:complete len:519 (-) Transcript_36820:538-2094(-)|eukprot:CAMPEP_0194133608 /NCGR_PEP_ID=MMETSP0152-20130528/3707_1 /TAXON_ID=1049557 /ORGANISM="Thalassiothrix antarctica, Strain L6-D1" /LENGTH=518 /DNA_ID=CAMNT_0038828943 /DNA_START=47 /DNA_END=1603 /DNA_ORIENTATION=-
MGLDERKKPKNYRLFFKRHLLILTIRKKILSIVVIFSLSFLLLFTITRKSISSRSRVRGPPSNYIVRPYKRSSYTSVPLEYRRTYYVDRETTYKATAIRAFRNIGWRRSSNDTTAQIVWDKTVDDEYFPLLQPWQRYNHIPGVYSWDNKDNFIRGFEEYKRKYHPHKKLRMLPETYQISTKLGIQRWRERLFQHDGMNEPWVLKEIDVNNGAGIDILGPNSKELKEIEESLDSQDYEKDGYFIAQEYICNELTWYGDFKFDLRYYWLVASLDPLIVLYHDGYVRVGNSQYDESDFSSTTKHLTTHTYLPDEVKAPAEDLAQLIREHYTANQRRLRSTIRNIDPYEHVRNQIKESVAETVAAFKAETFGNSKKNKNKKHKFTAENGFVIYGADFVIDNDLDVWYTESQEGPGWEEEFEFRLQLHKDLLENAFRIVEEIQNKIENNPSSNVLPLQNQASWDIIYAASSPDHAWMYQYENYIPRKDKKRCTKTTTVNQKNEMLKKKQTKVPLFAVKPKTHS